MNNETREMMLRRNALCQAVESQILRVQGKRFFSAEAIKEALESIANAELDIIVLDGQIIEALNQQIPQQD